MLYITDLASELLRGKPKKLPGIKIDTKTKFGIKYSTTIISTAEASKEIGKPIGTYINIQTKESNQIKNIIAILFYMLKTQINNAKKFLIIGLGNSGFIADSLGPKVLKKINANDKLMTFEPNVGGITGINSVDAIKAISDLCKPDLVIIIDSLVTASPNRIGTNYQISTSGISPGSGISRNNRTINSALLDVPVLALGVPLCTFISYRTNNILHVVPKDIDRIVLDSANIISSAINILV